MAIKQERMLALIAAGQDYRTALHKLVKLIETEDSGVQSKTQTAEEALLSIVSNANELFLLEHPLDSTQVIVIEAAYFKSNQRRNMAAADWQANKRAKLRGENYTRRFKPTAKKPGKWDSIDAEAAAEMEALQARQQEVPKREVVTQLEEKLEPDFGNDLG